MSTGSTAAVQALPGRRVQEVGVDDQHVLGREAGQRQTVSADQPAMSTGAPLSVAARRRSAAISMNVVAPGSAQPNRTSVTDRNVPVARVAGAVGQVEADVVPRHVEQASAVNRLHLGEIAYSGHDRLLRSRCISQRHHGLPTALRPADAESFTCGQP